ncbi:high choriolytic enzyme 1-like [Solea senegalensis]|uniref:High choriolytic enzyme 1-like n=1 Tax=Solea senegalensis TaxID=28829 RepID=A0AAV6QJ44_SOLSE|nr:zinc metalloproteinase nas-14-like [Solea senegalensis]KAG7493086.1 high choriolytic enzyme 1-like [Solea senegalensis]
MWTVLVVLVLLTAGYKAAAYDNELNSVLGKFCPEGNVVSGIESAYNDNNKDRQWTIGCRPLVGVSNCIWSGFFDLSQQELKYNCPADHVINAVYSIYDTSTQDRKWNFQCCTSTTLITFECRETSTMNYFGEHFSWTVPGESVLTGVSTHGKNADGDHRWSYSYCRAVIVDSETSASELFAANTADSLTDDDVVTSTKNSPSCDDCFWSNVNGLVQVPYTISDAFTSNEKTVIEKAINEFHLSTCVRFVPRTSQINYVSIVKKTGCWSKIGRSGGMQELSLGAGCTSKGIIQHELMHALGIQHEQSRSDRDIYVRINLDNVNTDYQSNFRRLDTINVNVPYDYSSLMHYGRKDFSKNGQDTVTPLIASASIGQRIGMTENDFLKINKLYSCKNYLHKSGEWDSEVGQSFTRQCPEGQAVSSITSAYVKAKRDRHWGVTCKAFQNTKICRWSAYVNEYSKAFNFECGDNEVIAGVHSEFSSLVYDRKWKFYCCKASFSLFNCNSDPFVNYYSEYFSWKVASASFLKAVTSIFDPNTGDRRWKFSYCQSKVE